MAQCAVIKGDFPLEIIWMFGDRQIRTDQLDMVVSDSGKRAKQLTIETVAARHAGEYTCVATNIAGSVSRSAILEVNGTCHTCHTFHYTREPILCRLHT